MDSIKKIYKIGHGPSSSHTMGPRKAAITFLEKCPTADKITTTLYGSLAATGKGHLTNTVIEECFSHIESDIIWEKETFLPYHPNALKFEAYKNGVKLDEWTAYSIGGGDIIDNEGIKKQKDNKENKTYPLTTLQDILKYCTTEGITLWEYVFKYEDDDIAAYLEEVWDTMKKAIERGLKEGVLPGSIHLQRKSSSYYIKANNYKGSLKRRTLVFAYALAASEENASGGLIVTAPTCGASGTLPALLYHLHNSYNFSQERIIKALATAGLIGNLVKKNASISGADVGCQGEIGTASSMAAGAAVQLFGGTPAQIEYAAEIALEHHLGLTCDPVAGLVQIPCIERNVFAAARALDASMYALLSDGQHMVSFDKTVITMNETGHDLPNLYKETSQGGLAKFFCCK